MNVVTDFGAVGDGVTDDTGAFQKALSTMGAAAGGIVFVPRGMKREGRRGRGRIRV